MTGTVKRQRRPHAALAFAAMLVALTFACQGRKAELTDEINRVHRENCLVRGAYLGSTPQEYYENLRLCPTLQNAWIALDRASTSGDVDAVVWRLADDRGFGGAKVANGHIRSVAFAYAPKTAVTLNAVLMELGRPDGVLPIRIQKHECFQEATLIYVTRGLMVTVQEQAACSGDPWFVNLNSRMVNLKVSEGASLEEALVAVGFSKSDQELKLLLAQIVDLDMIHAK